MMDETFKAERAEQMEITRQIALGINVMAEETKGLTVMFKNMMVEQKTKDEISNEFTLQRDIGYALGAILERTDIGDDSVNAAIRTTATRLRRLLPYGGSEVSDIDFGRAVDYDGEPIAFTKLDSMRMAVQLLKQVTGEMKYIESKEVRVLMKQLIEDVSYCIKTIK